MIDYILKCLNKLYLCRVCTIFLLVILFLLMGQSCMRMRSSSYETISFFNKAKIPFSQRKIQFDGYDMNFVETGSKENPPLIFVHGSPGSWNAYKKYLTDSLLLKKYRLIALDRPGFGYSDFADAQNLIIQTKRILALIDTLDLKKKVILVGHSYGGPLVLSLTTMRPQLFEHTVVLSGSVDPNLENPEKWRLFFMSKPMRYFVPGALRPSNDELWWLKKDLFDLQPTLKKITGKVTVIHGDKDRLVPYGNMKFMQLYLENTSKTDTLTIKRADHFIPWSHFDIIRDKLYNL